MSERGRFARGFRGSDLLIPVGVAVLYVLAAKLGLALAFQARQVSAVWPPAGLALAAVFWFGPRAVPGVFLGAFFANAMAEEPLWVAAGIALGNTLESLCGAWVLKRLDFDPKVARPRDALALLAAAAASPPVAASIGVVSLVSGGVQPVGRLVPLWSLWWLGDALGDLVIAPLLLVWIRRGGHSLRRGEYFEGPLMLAGLFAASMFAFVQRPPAPDFEYLVFPFLVWAALRFGPAASVTVTAITYGVAVWATHAGLGPFAGEGWEGGLVPLQLFMAVVAMTGLVLAAIAAQRREAQETAQMSERRLLLALGAARMGVWDWEIGTGAVQWSGELEPLHGLPRGGFAGTYEAFRALIHPQDRDRVESSIQKSVETRELYDSEFRILGEDGVERWTGARGQIVEDGFGRPVRMVGVGIDITRQKRLEEELRQRAEQMSETDRRKDEFLAMLAHELRNPLAPILHATELLGRGDPALAERAREIIRRQSEHLTRLVDDLLDVSRITRGAVRLDVHRIALGDAIAPALDTWRHVIGERRQELSIELPDRALWIEVDPTRFAQAVSNLLHNAANFTPAGGRISISAAEEQGSVVLRVRDTGAGMTPDVLRTVFDLFVQGPPPPGGQSSGLGLGLTLVRRLVELHGGTVEATSAGVGRGSEFVLRLPPASVAKSAIPADTASAGEPIPPAAAAEDARRVLVVDDNSDAREALRFLLEDEGHHVRTAADGPDALAEALAFRPDVVFLDIGLPGMDGYEVARRLRTQPGSESARIVAVSGYGQAEDRERSRAAGFDDHLLKPVPPNRLLDVVRKSAPDPDRTANRL
ncbi:MAG TPA: MASE1 domain-containing protein [Thermoanaerobaculia bacterium]